MQVEIIGRTKRRHRALTRVAAYCRVSEDSDRLLHSLEAQVAHYQSVIPRTPGCVFAGIYSDGAMTGTDTARPGFQRLLADCEAGRIDVVLVKSVSRFSRNTLDFLDVCRRLARLGVELRFEKERMSTADGEGELMLSLLASFSQEESRSISENIKWGIRRGFAEGRSAHYPLYGYRYEAGAYRLEPSEAAVVRRIFAAFLSGRTTWELEQALAAEGVPSPRGCRFSTSAILRILRNPTYTGDSVLQREYIADHITHRRLPNNGELAKYLVRGTHPAIVTHADFAAAQAELAARTPRKARAWYTGKVLCGECGRTFKYMRKHSGTGYFFCRGREKSGCACPRLREERIMVPAAALLGRETLDEAAFAAEVERVTVYRDRLTILMRNGGTAQCRM